MPKKSGITLRFRVLHAAWYADGEEFLADGEEGEHVIDDASPELVKLAGSAHAAGAIEVLEGLDTSHVQSQEDGEAALAEAMGEHVVENNSDGTRTSHWTGPWQEGQDIQAALDAEVRESGEGGIVDVAPATEEAA